MVATTQKRGWVWPCAEAVGVVQWGGRGAGVAAPPRSLVACGGGGGGCWVGLGSVCSVYPVRPHPRLSPATPVFPHLHCAGPSGPRVEMVLRVCACVRACVRRCLLVMNLLYCRKAPSRHSFKTFFY